MVYITLCVVCSTWWVFLGVLDVELWIEIEIDIGIGLELGIGLGIGLTLE
jgi:hypothetical protein